jgi:hypothetical protein
MIASEIDHAVSERSLAFQYLFAVQRDNQERIHHTDFHLVPAGGKHLLQTRFADFNAFILFFSGCSSP